MPMPHFLATLPDFLRPSALPGLTWWAASTARGAVLALRDSDLVCWLTFSITTLRAAGDVVASLETYGPKILAGAPPKPITPWCDQCPFRSAAGCGVGRWHSGTKIPPAFAGGQVLGDLHSGEGVRAN